MQSSKIGNQFFQFTSTLRTRRRVWRSRNDAGPSQGLDVVLAPDEHVPYLAGYRSRLLRTLAHLGQSVRRSLHELLPRFTSGVARFVETHLSQKLTTITTNVGC